MKNFIKLRLREELSTVNMDALKKNMTLPKKVNLSLGEINKIKTINWESIDFNEMGDDGRSMITLSVVFPFKTTATDGIVLKIELINDVLYQPHIDLDPVLQGLGLGYKIFRAFINQFGNIYTAIARVHNPNALKLFDKLKLDPNIESYDTSEYRLRILKSNPQKEEIKNLFGL